jgi:haloalkane dehalogenase
MNILRTPDERFLNLPDYPFAPHYLQLGAVRMHYVDEGAGEECVLMLHGEPSWSYLYRKMIPLVAQAGYRVIAPDLIGFGKSDKPTEQIDYSYQAHVDWVLGLVKELDLQKITLVCQDWGGLIGLRIAAEHPERFTRISAANTFLPTGDFPMPESFLKWQHFSQTSPTFDVGRVIKGGTVQPLSPEIQAAYDAPFPDDRYLAGARIFPSLVPATPDDPASAPNRKAWQALGQWTKPFQTAFSDQDPITGGADRLFHKMVPGTQGQPHLTIEGGGHFLQEDKGEVWAAALLGFMRG